MKTTYVLANIGTPQSPEPKDVGAYLKEFLMDPDVITLPFPLRWFLVNVLVVPRRKYASGEAYAKVWGERGSPLLTITEDLCTEMNKSTENEEEVVLAMRYGSPSVSEVLKKHADSDRIVIVPMFPQYADATTQSIYKKSKEVAGELGISGKMTYLEEFYADGFYADVLAKKTQRSLDQSQFDFLLFSYHGLPKKQIQSKDQTSSHCLVKENCCDQITSVNSKCYRAQCFATTRAVMSRLNTPLIEHSVSFQSRLGPTEWIRPYTDETVRELAKKGVKKLAVVCPAFLIDCLETLEEISIGLKEQFIECGGEDLVLVPCLNDDADWAQSFLGWIRQKGLPQKNEAKSPDLPAF